MSSEQVAAIERLRELENSDEHWDDDKIQAAFDEALPLIEALQQSLSEAQADARVFSGSYNALAVDFGRLKEELQETQDDKLYVDSESQMLINENNQLKAENERLKSEAERTDKAFSKTLKDLTFSKRESKKFCDLMMKNVNKCCEFQNEIERLREGIGRALAKMKGIADCAEQLEESAEQEFFGAIEELEALHDA